LKSCCVVPPDLQAFAKENQIKLHTHADPPSILTQDFMEKIQKTESSKNPEWIIRYQLFIKARGVLQDKRYIIPI
jgi:glutamate--cysteine ligase regulatory subunit